MSPVQLLASPLLGEPDFSRLNDTGFQPGPLDPVSLADLLRNGFVYPPYSIFDNVRLVGCGFDPRQDMFGDPSYRPMFRECRQREARPTQDWAGEYHRMLCKAAAVASHGMSAPWLLQSGGKDSTSLAIALADARPDTTCITYLGGREENEVASARHVARSLGLRHEYLVCDAGRAYDRYLKLIPRIPLLTADFAMLSYADLATDIARQGGDGILDGLGSDLYLGIPADWHKRLLLALARSLHLPDFLTGSRWLARSFELSYLLTTLQMHPFERGFPGSRFTDAEVDSLFGREISARSKARLARFAPAFAQAGGLPEQLSITLDIMACPGGIAKGLYTAAALQLRVTYPYCNRELWEWVTNKVPPEQRMDVHTGVNKVMVREHIARRFPKLPYVAAKGSFRFDVRDLARQRFDQVHAFAGQMQDLLPGARDWLERHRDRLQNKCEASKFYLLAVVLPWLQAHATGLPAQARLSQFGESSLRRLEPASPNGGTGSVVLR